MLALYGTGIKYLRGGNVLESKLINGETLAEMAKLPDKSIDMILCDLPYGTTRNKWDSVIPLDKLWEQYERIIKDNGAIVLTAQTPFDKVLGASNLRLLRYEWIWDKKLATGHLNAKRMPMKVHENVLVFYKKLPAYNPQMREGVPYDKGFTPEITSTNYGRQVPVRSVNTTGERYPVTILQFSNANRRSKVHPTQKPVDLFEYLIKTYTKENDLVLDNTMGSGTTCVAAVNTGRRYIGIELDKEYFAIAEQRVKDAIKESGGGY